MTSTHVEVKGTMVQGVESPSLDFLKSEKCTKAQLQAALVQLIEIVNMNQIDYRKWADHVDAALEKKQDKPITFGR